MQVWRLEKRSRHTGKLSGEGASITGGRWNPKGIPVIYTSASLSLATLEILVNIGSLQHLSLYTALRINVPDTSVTGLQEYALPRDWNTLPVPRGNRMIGARWYRQKTSLVLEVPSACVRYESNYLINPDHPLFPEVRILERVDDFFDERLLGLYSQREESGPHL